MKPKYVADEMVVGKHFIFNYKVDFPHCKRNGSECEQSQDVCIKSQNSGAFHRIERFKSIHFYLYQSDKEFLTNNKNMFNSETLRRGKFSLDLHIDH